MQNFLGYGTCDSAYDSRRHIACLLMTYASYKLQVNPNIMNTVKNALAMGNYTQSHQYLLQYLYDSDFYQFIESLGRRYNISSQELSYLSSGELFKIGITKTPAGYERSSNKILAVHLAYLQHFFRPLNFMALSQLTNSFSIPLLKGTKGGFTEAELRKIFSLVNAELVSGNTSLSSIEATVSRQV